jgi:uracil-DNA glycosylase family 4
MINKFFSDKCQKSMTCEKIGGHFLPPQINSKCKLAVVGDIPSVDEEKFKKIGIGRAGFFVLNIIKQAGIDREDLSLLNAVNCRPLKGKPNQTEIKACRPNMMRILKHLYENGCRYILLLGSIACQSFFQEDKKISEIRGKLLSIPMNDGSKLWIMPTYHPSYILYNINDKPILEQDIKVMVDLALGGAEPEEQSKDENTPVIMYLNSEELALDGLSSITNFGYRDYIFTS